MRICYCITRSEKGGAQVHLLELIKFFSQEHEIILIVGSKDTKENKDFLVSSVHKYNAKVFLLEDLNNESSLLKDIKIIREIAKILKNEKVNLLHAHSSKAGILSRVAAKLVKVPSIFTAHGWAFTDGVPLKRKAIAIISEWFVGLFTDKIITVSKYDERLSRKWHVGKNITTIYNGVADYEIDLSSSIFQYDKKDKVVVVMVARFDPPKDQKLLIEAVAQVENIELWLVGNGSLINDSKALVKRLNIEDRVVFWGNRNDVREILSKADVFALISNYEGFPISTLEAMQMGLPVIVSDVGGAAEAIIEGKNGFLNFNNDIFSLIDILKLLSSDEIDLEKYGNSSKEIANNQFNRENMLISIDNIYKNTYK